MSPQHLPTLSGTTTLELAKDSDSNMLQKLSLPHSQRMFFDHLWANRHVIVSIVRHHLNLRDQNCSVTHEAEWMVGSFNVCIPVHIRNWQVERVLFRCPLPYKLGGLENADEKVRCEAATYTWIQENCPGVPIPYLWGAGVRGTGCFTPFEILPWRPWLIEKFKRMWASFRRQPRYSRLAVSQSPSTLESGYLILEFVEEGQLLAECWPSRIRDGRFRLNLYRSLAQIMLTLGQPSDRIGSFTLDDVGRIVFTNRPLTLRLHALENQRVPAVIPRNRQYSSSLHYFSDLLQYHDEQLRHQPNSIRSVVDANSQMATLTIMRSLIPDYFQKEYREGPFLFQLTDLRHHNIFVREDGQITKIVDLEWACFLPIECNYPPFWVAGYELDHLMEGNALEVYDMLSQEFLEIQEEQEASMASSGPPVFPFAHIIKEALRRGTHWCIATLNQPRTMYDVFIDHIQPKFAPQHQLNPQLGVQFEETVAAYWAPNSEQFVASKLKEREQYMIELEKKFQFFGALISAYLLASLFMLLVCFRRLFLEASLDAFLRAMSMVLTGISTAFRSDLSMPL